ncbi:hypothetical protein OFB47_30760, partial [Escherichia coli]|nr:hypothetical protein [Escherichia coli]
FSAETYAGKIRCISVRISEASRRKKPAAVIQKIYPGKITAIEFSGSNGNQDKQDGKRQNQYFFAVMA